MTCISLWCFSCNKQSVELHSNVVYHSKLVYLLTSLQRDSWLALMALTTKSVSFLSCSSSNGFFRLLTSKRVSDDFLYFSNIELWSDDGAPGRKSFMVSLSPSSSSDSSSEYISFWIILRPQIDASESHLLSDEAQKLVQHAIGKRKKKQRFTRNRRHLRKRIIMKVVAANDFRVVFTSSLHDDSDMDKHSRISKR